MKDRVREALFDVLGPPPPGTGVLDLFAGSGVVGLEALSRGAAWAVAVERDPLLVAAIREHARAFEIERRLTVVAADVLAWWNSDRAARLPRADTWWVFCCPPYERAATQPDRLAALLQSIVSAAPAGSRFVLETDDRFDGTAHLGAGWSVRSYRPAVLWIR